jgi:hypothetical protein
MLSGMTPTRTNLSATNVGVALMRSRPATLVSARKLGFCGAFSFLAALLLGNARHDSLVTASPALAASPLEFTVDEFKTSN